MIVEEELEELKVPVPPRPVRKLTPGPMNIVSLDYLQKLGASRKGS